MAGHRGYTAADLDHEDYVTDGRCDRLADDDLKYCPGCGTMQYDVKFIIYEARNLCPSCNVWDGGENV